MEGRVRGTRHRRDGVELTRYSLRPFDVVKTQRQSGRHPGVSALALLSNAARDGALFRGLLPGLVRSSIANGTSMVVYKKVHAELSRLAGRDDHSNI